MRPLGTLRDPDMFREFLGLLGLQVVGAILLAEQIPRGLLLLRGRRRPAESQLRPPQRRPAESQPGEVADGMHGYLGIIRARLDAQVALGDGGLDEVVDHLRQLGELLGHSVGDAEPVPALGVDEQRPAETERDRQPTGPEVGCLPRVVWRGQRVSLEGPARTDRQSLNEPGGGIGPVSEQLDQVLPGLVGPHVEGGEVKLLLGRGDDSRLVLTVERIFQAFACPVRGPFLTGTDGAGGEESSRA